MQDDLQDLDKLDLRTDESFSTKETKILQATLAVCNRYGFDDTPISKISQLSGASVGEMYQIFENREALISQLYIAIRRQSYLAISKNLDLEALRSVMDQPYDKKMNHFQLAFDLLWENASEFFLQHTAHYTFIEHISSFNFITTETLVEAEKYASNLYTFISLAQEADLVKTQIDPFCFAFAFHGNISAVVRLKKTKKFSTEKANSIKNICWHGMIHK